MKMQRIMSQIKGQDKTPGEKEKKKPKWSGHRQSFRKRIQNIDSEDDPGSWKGMEKMQEVFTKDLEELKNKQTDE